MLLYLLCMPRSTRGLALVSDWYLPKPHLLYVRHHTIHPTDAVLHSTRRRYERFLKIMMLSVVKKTKAPVKFWLLNNFLSPQFKTAIPKMAAHYGSNMISISRLNTKYVVIKCNQLLQR